MLESMFYLLPLIYMIKKEPTKNNSWVIWETGTCLGLKDVSEKYLLHLEGIIKGIL